MFSPSPLWVCKAVKSTDRESITVRVRGAGREGCELEFNGDRVSFARWKMFCGWMVVMAVHWCASTYCYWTSFLKMAKMVNFGYILQQLKNKCIKYSGIRSGICPSDFNFPSLDLLVWIVCVWLRLESMLRNAFTEQAFPPMRWSLESPLSVPSATPGGQLALPSSASGCGAWPHGWGAVPTRPTGCYWRFHRGARLPSPSVHAVSDFIIPVLVCIPVTVWGDWGIFHDCHRRELLTKRLVSLSSFSLPSTFPRSVLLLNRQNRHDTS